MNDDPVAASSASRLPTQQHDDDDDDEANHANDHSDEGSQDEHDAGEGSSRHPAGARRRRSHRRSSSRVRRAKAGIAKKLEFTTNLMSSLDGIVFAELCVLYYMDCSFGRLLMRALVQYMYLTPKPEEFLRLMPAPRPQMHIIFGANIICTLMHLIFAPLEASESMRGYLHGGIIIDFIGQKAPTSRFGLVLLDLLVLALQCILCAAWLEKERLKRIEKTLRSVAAGGFPKSNRTHRMPAPVAAMDVNSGAVTLGGQDLDAEERGVLRDDPLGTDEPNSIEMQPLRTRRDVPGRGSGGGTSRILEARYHRILRTLGGSHSEEGPDRPSLVDVLMSGNGLLANFHVVHAIRTLIADNASEPVATGYPLQLTGYTSRLAAMAAASQARLARASGQTGTRGQ